MLQTIQGEEKLLCDWCETKAKELHEVYFEGDFGRPVETRDYCRECRDEYLSHILEEVTGQLISEGYLTVAYTEVSISQTAMEVKRHQALMLKLLQQKYEPEL